MKGSINMDDLIQKTMMLKKKEVTTNLIVVQSHNQTT